MTASSGSRYANDFYLIILEARGEITDQRLSNDEQCEAVHEGDGCLRTTPQNEDKNGIGNILHASSQGDARVYLARQVANADGRPSSRLIAFIKPDWRAEDNV